MFRKSRDRFFPTTVHNTYFNLFSCKLSLFILLTFIIMLFIKPGKIFAANSFEGPKKHYFSLPDKNRDGVQNSSLNNYKGPVIRGPVAVHLPRRYKWRRSGEKFPLLLSLHGFGSFPLFHEGFFKLRKTVNAKRFILATLPGSFNETGMRFWNAGDWCCDFFKSGRDDVEYILHVLKRLKKLYAVDTTKVALLGHSNGGFMSYRLLCEHPELFSGVISLAGAMPKGVGPCKKPHSASIIQVHGTKDVVIKYNGSPLHVSAEKTASHWVKHQKCDQQDYKTNQGLILKWGSWPKVRKIKSWDNCQTDSKVSLWSISKEGHFADLTQNMRLKMIDYIF